MRVDIDATQEQGYARGGRRPTLSPWVGICTVDDGKGDQEACCAGSKLIQRHECIIAARASVVGASQPLSVPGIYMFGSRCRRRNLMSQLLPCHGVSAIYRLGKLEIWWGFPCLCLPLLIFAVS